MSILSTNGTAKLTLSTLTALDSAKEKNSRALCNSEPRWRSPSWCWPLSWPREMVTPWRAFPFAAGIAQLSLLVAKKKMMDDAHCNGCSFIPGSAKLWASFATRPAFSFQKPRARFPNMACQSFANDLKFDLLTRLENGSMEPLERALGVSFPCLLNAYSSW